MLQGKIKSLEQIFLFSLPVKEYQIVESFLQSSLKDEVMKIMPVQKQTRAGQRTRFKVLPGLTEDSFCWSEVVPKDACLTVSAVCAPSMKVESCAQVCLMIAGLCGRG